MAKRKKKSKDGPGVLGALRAVVGAGGWLLLAAVAGGVAWGSVALDERVGRVRADPLDVRFDWPAIEGDEGGATWMPRGERRRLHDLVRSRASLDPTDGASLDAAREALARTGWFREGPTLTRRPAGVIDVDGAWRAPAAVVRREGSEHVVSRSARRLPLAYSEGQSWPLRVITGAWGGPPRETGAVWAGGDVEAALDLLALLRESGAWERVGGVDASRYVREGSLNVVTTGGATLVWGAPPGETKAGQVEQEVRLRRFEKVLDDPSWINAGRPRVRLHTPVMLIDETAR